MGTRGLSLLSVLTAHLLCAPFSGAEESASSPSWREALSDKGVELEAVFTVDTLGNAFGGGLKRGARSVFNVDLTTAVDTEKAGLWQNGRAFLYVLGNFGSSPSAIIGDAQVATNIDAPTAFKVYEAWYEHAFFDGAFTLLGGLHDYNSEFNSLEYAGTLIHPSFGVTPEVAQVGPSIFPTTSLAVRALVQPIEQLYMMFALYDGVPGDPDNPRGTHVILKRSDGLFYASEVGVVSAEDAVGDYYKLGVGGWIHTTDFEDFEGRERSRNQGLYLIGEKQLFAEADGEQGLGAFLQFGFADGGRNEFNRYYGGGLTYQGIIPSRDADVLSLGYASVHHGDAFLESTDDALRWETAFELTYRAEITSWLTLQPDVQYIVNPGAAKGVSDAKVIGLRVEVAL
jgi:porin